LWIARLFFCGTKNPCTPDGRSQKTTNMKRRKKGRPKITDGLKKETILRFRVDNDQLFIIKGKAEFAKKRISDFVREAALKSIVKAAVTPEIMREFRGINNLGNNLNQNMKLAHQNGYTDEIHAECRDLRAKLNVISDRLIEIL
jgi:hypothetical protein